MAHELHSTSPLLLLLLLFALSLLSSLSQCQCRPAFACGGGPALNLPFCRTKLPIHARVRDLIGRLTPEEKIKLLVNNAAGVSRLGISGYEWWSEALHGVSNVGPGTRFGGNFPGATSFPQVISTASSFNATLWELIGRANPLAQDSSFMYGLSNVFCLGMVSPHPQVVSDEARAMYNGGQAGLTFWSPNVNVFRDPRWGRGQETPGEDPFVVGKYAAAYVRGLQQPYAGNRLKLAACCKHYTAYDLDNWKGNDRFHFNARVSKQDLEDTFDVPFRMCVVEGKAASVMCSYNQVNGVPTCADRNLLRNTIRGQWNLAGYIVSDCDSVGVYYNDQHYSSSRASAGADAIKAGLDLDCGPFLGQHTGDALKQNLVRMADIDNALTNTITVQMRLGMYDGDPSTRPFGHLGPTDTCTPAHKHLALEAARQGVVLLKNERRALPLSHTRIRSVAVIGPNAAATVTMIGNYAGIPCGYTTPVQGIGRFARTVHQPGCSNVACVGNQPIDAAVQAARTSDTTVLIMGLDQSMEAEARDRDTLLLPGRQQELISKVAMASKGPTVLVLMCGGPVDVSFAKNDPRIPAILWVGYPGQAGGAAIAEAIFGAFSPGGKLPMTWYPQQFANKVPMTDMAMRTNPSKGYPGRTYRFYDGPVVFPFGHGLSYTSFKHTIAQAATTLSVPLDGRRASLLNSTVPGRAVRVTHARCNGLSISLHVDVMNTGNRHGWHTVLVFSTTSVGKLQGGRASKQLVAFEKVSLAAKSQARVTLGIDVCRDLSFADSYGIRRIPMGEHSLQIGESTHSVSLRAEAVRI